MEHKKPAMKTPESLFEFQQYTDVGNIQIIDTAPIYISNYKPKHNIQGGSKKKQFCVFMNI